MKKKLNLKEQLRQMKPLEDKFKDSGSSNPKDERMYIISKDEKGEGKVLIRFLPFIRKATEGVDDIVARKHHSFDYKHGTKKRWMNEDCLSMIGEDCPVCDEAWERYNHAKDLYGKEKARYYLKEVAKSEYYVNILVEQDDIKPENNGKIFIYKFGPQLAQIIQEQSNPTDEEKEEKGLEEFIVSDIFESHAFRLWLTPPEKKGEFPHWKKSYFSPKPEHKKDITDVLINIAKEKDPDAGWTGDLDEDLPLAISIACYDLDEFRDGTHSLKPEELLAIYHKTIGVEEGTSSVCQTEEGGRKLEDVEDSSFDPTADVEESEPTKESEPIEEPKPKPEKKTDQPKKEETEPTDGDVDIDDFLKDIM